ncbi:MAG: SDR family oxidoreductase [Candidatus Omnitrophica bacterium]|jgi:thioester reductase-like protein|nr:SDR family oxidoreductase [Candidatus Omnitrophota bacterium]
MKKKVFLTGATGLVGSYLAKILLSEGHKIIALARFASNKNPPQRVKEALNLWGQIALDNLEVLEGDICLADLGLDKKSRARLDKIQEIFHCAAITDLNLPIEKLRQTNVTGTKNILELSLSLKKKSKLERTSHISTAYVYGNYAGTFTEKDLDKGQSFPTNYEKSKFEAEILAYDYRRQGLWVDIYRPSMVIGDSTTGRIFESKHMYQLLKLCSLEIFPEFPLKNSWASLVPVDLTCQAIYILWSRHQKPNCTFHPFPARLVSIEQMLDIAGEIMGFKPPKVVSLEQFKPVNLTPAQRKILQETIFNINFHTGLDSTYTNNLLQGYGFTMPEVDEKMLRVILAKSA